MPKRTDIKKILVIGSGPIVIGQAAEFDYAGTQACRALKEEGVEVVLVNSNPATIMTDVSIADKVYMEPLTVEYLAKILRFERPHAIVPGIGGQTGLNLAMELREHPEGRGPGKVQGAVLRAWRAGGAQRDHPLRGRSPPGRRGDRLSGDPPPRLHPGGHRRRLRRERGRAAGDDAQRPGAVPRPSGAPGKEHQGL